MILPFLNLYLLATQPGLCGGYSLNRHSAHDLIHPGTGRLLKKPRESMTGKPDIVYLIRAESPMEVTFQSTARSSQGVQGRREGF